MAEANKLLMKELRIQPEGVIPIFNTPEGYLDLLSHTSGQKSDQYSGPLPEDLWITDTPGGGLLPIYPSTPPVLPCASGGLAHRYRLNEEVGK